MTQEKTEKELQETFASWPGLLRYGLGRRFELTMLAPENGLRKMLERHKQVAEKWLGDVRNFHVPSMGAVHFDYVENLRFGAFAFESGNHDFVGIYTGAIPTIYCFFGSLLAYPRLLMNIGNPLAEQELDWGTVDMNRRPNDATRQSLASLLSAVAIEFLFAHEIGHLMNGHVKYLNGKTGVALLAEFDSIQRTSEEFLVRQALEMDADSFAAAQGVSAALGRASQPSLVFPEHWRQWYTTQKQALFVWMLAIYGLFRLLFKGTVDLSHLDSTVHPPPQLRLSWAYGTAIELLKKRGLEELIPEFGSNMGEVIKTVEIGHALMTSTKLDPSALQQVVDIRAHNHLGRVLDQWKILRPELVPLNRGGRLAD